MTDRQDFVMVAIAVCVAGYIALAADYVAHQSLGFSSAHIRAAATGTAIVVASLLAIDYFGKKLRRARQQNKSDRLDRQ
jgi:uncharacterized membrane protein